MRIKALDVGKIVKYKGVRLIVVKAVDKCRGCFFKRLANCHPSIVGACAPPWRTEEIIFRRYDASKPISYHTKVSEFGSK